MKTGDGGRLGHHDNETSLALYDAAAAGAAATVIKRYSTSFSAGARLLPADMRSHIAAVYAMVRVGDEIVDTYRGADSRALLDGLESEVLSAMDRGFSANLIAHAFGVTARAVGITAEFTEPYFASMRMDIDQTVHTPESFDRYVYGSAEVVGEMCLAVFVNTSTGPRPIDPAAREGARRLGAGYQKINFLRDLAMDDVTLGRSYFPSVTAANLTQEKLAELVEECRGDIAVARTCLTVLPRRAAVSVRTTIDIYTRLLDTIARTPAEQLVDRRVRVPNPVKVALAVRNTVMPTAWVAS